MLLIVHLLTSKILRLSNCKNLGFVTCVYRTVWCVHSSCCTRTKQAMDLLMILYHFFFLPKGGESCLHLRYRMELLLDSLVLCSGTLARSSRYICRMQQPCVCVRVCVRACVYLAVCLWTTQNIMTVRPIRWTARHCIQKSLQWLYW